jgi:ABC-type dipeptide/oligopeptide/nickel transport system permease component
MRYYLIRRILLVIPVSWAIGTFIFLVVRVLPGDPAMAILGDYATPQALAELREQLGLNYPLWRQYFFFFRDILSLNLGQSMISGMPVGSMIARAFPYTLELVVFSMSLSVIIGIPLGLMTALRRNTIYDYLGRLFSILGLSVPDYCLGIVLILVFSIGLGWLPMMGGGDAENFLKRIPYLLLPAITLALIVAAFITRMTRSTMLEIMGLPYIRTARSKGLRETVVIYKHALRNAFIPIITVVGVYLNVLLGGTVLVEIIFSRPGLGKMIVGAIMDRDYMLLQSLLFVFSFLIVFINLAIDIVYKIIDPRIKYK